MNTDKTVIENFLHETKMHPDMVDMDKTVSHIMDEMQHGLMGEASSLKMLPTYIDVDVEIPAKKSAVVLDAGGTNLRTALVTFTAENEPSITDYRKHPMPGTRGQTVGREEFFDVLASLVETLIYRSETIGFCFSYPTEIFSNRDGRLIHWSKEIKAPEVEGRMIGADLRDALTNRGIKNTPNIVILNDAVATLLTGKASNASRPWGGYVGFILGTGTNTCYVESNSKIGKVPSLNPSKTQVINCESGNYACPSRGEADFMLGEITANPEMYWLEKMLSGAYFGQLSTQAVRLAGMKTLLSSQAIQSLAEEGDFTSKDADNYCHNPYGTADNAVAKIMMTDTTDSDRRRLWYIIDALLERAAKLSAANLAASVLKGASGKGPLTPTCLTIDGTTYYRYYRFQHRMESYLRPYLSKRDMYYESFRVEEAPLIGAAVAALTNAG